MGADIAELGTRDPARLMWRIKAGGLPVLQALSAGGCALEPHEDPEKDPLALAALAGDPDCETFIRALFDSRQLREGIEAPPGRDEARATRI